MTLGCKQLFSWNLRLYIQLTDPFSDGPDGQTQNTRPVSKAKHYEDSGGNAEVFRPKDAEKGLAFLMNLWSRAWNDQGVSGLLELLDFSPNSLLLGVLNSFLRCVRPLCHCWCPPSSAGHVEFLFICLPRSVTGGVRPFPLAM